MKDERHAEAFLKNLSLAKEDALSLGERVAALENQGNGARTEVKMGRGGSREMTFVKRNYSKNNGREDEGARELKKRSIKSLGLKSDRPSFHGKRGKSRGGYTKGKSKRS